MVQDARGSLGASDDDARITASISANKAAAESGFDT
jgi:hypothetical protein